MKVEGFGVAGKFELFQILMEIILGAISVLCTNGYLSF